MLPKAIMTRKDIGDRKEGGMSRFSKSESAAATALAAVLLLALVFTMIAVVKLEYVPDWKDDAERDHMYNTIDEMAEVKTNIDILSELVKLNNYSSHNISVTVPIDMGGGQIPFLEPSKSDGKLGVNTERYAMTIVPRTSSPIINPYTLKNYTFECGGITCYSENRQYPDQIFRYENGALILANDKGSVMRQPPAFTIEENETNKGHYKIAVQVVQLSGKPDSISSNTIIPLQLKGDSNQIIYDSNDYKNTTLDNKNITLQNLNGFNLTIATRYPDAWIAYFNETAQENGLEYGRDYAVQYLEGSGHVRFSFLPSGKCDEAETMVFL
jgi:hypothetical protein